MEIKIRKTHGNFIDLQIVDGNTTIDCGLLSPDEMKEYEIIFRIAADEIKHILDNR